MSQYTSSLEAVYAIRDNASPAPQNENRLVAFLRTQLHPTSTGRLLNGFLFAAVVILAVAHLALAATSVTAHSVTEAPAVWVSEDGSTVYGEGEAIIGSSLEGSI